MGAEAAIAIMRHREREVRSAFQEAGAIDPATSRGLDQIGIEETMAFRRLCNRAVVRESSPGCYYFDEESWQALRSMRLKFALTLLAAVALVALVGLYAASASR